jgi:hypothetical protein
VTKLQLLPDRLIDGLPPFDTRETWERHLAELKSLNPSVIGDCAIERAEEMVAQKKEKASASGLWREPDYYLGVLAAVAASLANKS